MSDHRGVFREFTATTQAEEFMHFSGFDLTLDEVIEAETRYGEPIEEPECEFDTTIWQGGKLVALIRRRVGVPPDVIRFSS